MSSNARHRYVATSQGDWQRLIDLLSETPSTERRTRRHLIYALEGLAPPEAVPVLRRIAVDEREDRYTRVAALEALTKFGDRSALPEALALLEHGPPRVRREAAKLVGKLAGEEAEQALIEALHANDKGARAAAAEALGVMASAGVVSALAQKVNEKENLLVRQEAALALHRIDTPEAQTQLARELARAGPLARWRIRRWIATMH